MSKEILQKDLREQREVTKQLMMANDNLRDNIKLLQNALDQAHRELIQRDQTIRSLHWALSMATTQIRNHQKENVKEFLKLAE